MDPGALGQPWCPVQPPRVQQVSQSQLSPRTQMSQGRLNAGELAACPPYAGTRRGTQSLVLAESSPRPHARAVWLWHKNSHPS